MRLEPLRRADPRRWPLTARVVAMTTLLSTLAILSVGLYLSTVISDGMFEQRRDRVIGESVDTREDLVTSLQGLAGATATQQQDAATAFVRQVGTGDDSGRRDAALLPVGGSAAVSAIATDPSMTQLIDPALADAVAESPDALSWRSVGRSVDGSAEPGIMVGTRVAVPGGGSYDLFLLYSLEQEQQTLTFVQRVMVGGGLVLLSLVVGISVVVARLVVTPLRRAASAAEQIAAGDLASRMEVAGADELARVGVSFNQMAGNLEQKIADLTELSRAQQRFVSDVSHELRTPLTTIRMATSMLDGARREGAFPPDLARSTELLSGQVRRFEALLAELLEISRFDAGAAVLEARREDIAALATRTAGDLAVLAEERGCVIDVRRGEGDLHAVADPRRVDRILRNLLSNALEHGAGRPVRVRIDGDENAVAVSVQDHGVGMTPADAERVFDRFWRADPSRARTIGGTGLGLAISVEDAHLHGGWLQAWGQLGQGAVVRLTLPRRPGDQLVSSPLPLHVDFEAPDAPAAGTDAGDGSGGEAPAVGPGDLPALPTADSPAPARSER
ncbi:MAG: MtrAB system histidine kinase MtrB [Brachybacterium sp.]|nr:MtrAB system histidine kinase MtrB [Brachybacterium sp.]